MRIKTATKKALFTLMAVLVGTFSSALQPVMAASTPTKTITVEFPESLEQNRSQTITIPGLREVKSVSVNTGEVSYEVNGNDVTIHVKNGSPSRTYTPSKTVTVKRTQDGETFPETINYNEGGFQGTLYKSGPTYEDGTRVDTKTVTVKQGPQSSTVFPDTIQYSQDGYTGTLYKSGAYFQDGYVTLSKYVTRTLGPRENTNFPSSIFVEDNGYSGYIGGINGPYSYYSGSGIHRSITLRSIDVCYEWQKLGCPSGYFAGILPHEEEIDGKLYSGYLYAEYSTKRCYLSMVVDTIVGKIYYYNCSMTYSGIVFQVGYCMDYGGYIYKHEPQYSQNYSGTVTKTVKQYSQEYTGIVYGTTQRYYSYIVTLEVEAIDTTIAAGVYHTDAWVKKRGIDRTDPNFLAGEAFLVEVETSADAENIDLSVSPSIPLDVSWSKERDGDIVRWKTVLYDPAYKDMKGAYTFTIKVFYPEDLTNEEQVQVYVSGNIHGLSNIHLTQ